MQEWLYEISPVANISSNNRTYPYERNWLEPLRVIYDHQLVLFRYDDFVVEIDGTEYACPHESFIIIPPGQWHLTRALGRRPGERYWTHFDWSYQGAFHRDTYQTFHPAKPVEKLYRHAPSCVPQQVFHGTLRNPRRAFELQEQLSDRLNDADVCRSMTARALLLELLVLILCAELPHARARAKGASRASKIRHALQQLAEMPHSETSSIDWALSSGGFSYAHQARLFKKRYGITPLYYVNAVRVEHIKHMLRDTDRRVIDIAAHFGYRNAHYFNRVFKRYTGMTPLEYRQECS
jgi:AraC-like DNA-binding protein